MTKQDGGQESPDSTVGLEPTPAGAKPAQPTTPGQEPSGVNKKTKKLRREAESLRERLRAAEKERDEARAGQQTEAERKEKRLAELEAESLKWKEREQALQVKNAVTKAALKRGLDPDLAEKLLNWSTIRFDEESGEPKGIGKALDALLSQYPILQGQPAEQPTIGATNPQRAPAGSTGFKADPANPPRLSDTLKW